MSKEAEFTLKEVTEVVLFIKDNMATPADVERIIDNRVPKIINDMVPVIINDLVPGIVHPIINSAVSKAKLDLIDHIDRKTAEVRGDLVVISRKLDKKIDFLTDTLANKNVLTKSEAMRVKNTSPFPRVTAA